MADIKVIYGSTTGSTEAAAETIAGSFGVSAINVASAAKTDFEADLLILGCSTWGIGELQDDWISGISLLESMDLNGKKVAVFGTGDQVGFAETYCDAIGILAAAAEGKGAVIVGKTSAAGYSFEHSAALQNDLLCGLALDENNQPELTAGRVAAWVEQLKKEVDV